MLGRVHPLYAALVPLGLAALFPVWLIRSLWRPDDRRHLRERFGQLPRATRTRLASLPRRPLWVHAVSVGEMMVARRLINALGDAGYRAPVVVSSSTAAGRDLASAPGLAAEPFYLPVDWSPLVESTMRQVNPAAFLSVETEIWPSLFAACARRGVPVTIASGRISERSRQRYARFARIFQPAFSSVSLACMQTDDDAERVRALGVAADRVAVTGSIKFDAQPSPPSEELTSLLRARPTGGQVVVAGSTSAGEEEIILDAVAALHHPDLTLILAPRHRERFDEVAGLLAARGLVWRRRSAMAPWPDPPAGSSPRVILLDSLGELASVYALADVAFVGGSLVPRGGQNLLEPAAFGVPVLCGPRVDNFRAVADALLAAGAAFEVADAGSLAARLQDLLSHDAARQAAGRAGKSLVEAHRGATRRTIERLIPALGAA